MLVRAEAWFLHAANLLVGGTGLVYGWMCYLLEPADEWAIVNHAWQPDLQHLHVLTAPLLVFAVGLIWRDHVWGRIQLGVRARRRAGLFLALSFLPMAASGYLVQVATDEGWRLVWAWVHGATSLFWIGGYVVHQLERKRARRV